MSNAFAPSSAANQVVEDTGTRGLYIALLPVPGLVCYRHLYERRLGRIPQAFFLSITFQLNLQCTFIASKSAHNIADERQASGTEAWRNKRTVHLQASYSLLTFVIHSLLAKVMDKTWETVQQKSKSPHSAMEEKKTSAARRNTHRHAGKK